MNSIYGDGSNANSLIDIPTYQDLFGPNGWQFEASTYKDAEGKTQPYTAEQQKLDFWNYIQQDPYLRTHTGQTAERNGVVAPWVHQIDIKLAQNFYFYTGAKHHKHTIQLGLDIENFANLLNPWWGNNWSISVGDGYGNTKPLDLTNPAKVYLEGAKPVFKFQRSGNRTLDSTYYRTNGTSSTWSMMVSARYIF